VAGTVRIRRALVSVSDKTGLEAFARELVACGAEIVSTGGTAAALARAGIPCVPIEEVTGFPEMMDGRVKTLHPRVHGGLLAVRDDPAHVAAMEAHGIRAIDLVCVNLYPFESTVAKPGIAEHEAVEQIDIGGPSMVRSAAKNHASVAVVTDPAQYAAVVGELRANDGCTTLALRRRLAHAAFARTAAYDAAISTWMAGSGFGGASGAAADELPEEITVRLARTESLRYGENPHQRGAVYRDLDAGTAGIVGARMLHGKQLSYNNLLDASAAVTLVADLASQLPQGAACAVIKHTNPCGAAVAGTVLESFERAWAGDPLAAFGGIVAFGSEVDAETARAMAEGERFLEVVIAPGFAPEALATLQARWKNARILATGPIAAAVAGMRSMRTIPGGMLVQDRDAVPIDGRAFTHAAGPVPGESLRWDAAVLFTVAKHLTSNAVCIGGDGALWGAGAGQMDRVASCRNAVEKARARLASRAPGSVAVAASDAFFPFADGPTLLADAGVGCIVHPGGSKRDQDTLDLCNARGITCLLTGTRHFRH
jgi:phosphoribosylaminoimidazolecarboxamide formyltransferase/IMP cyclohydrolase